ncbi:Calcium-transporting ATPase [Actinidia chinensis var. chinensis]|uniref:Calcium-transporting ATPase n=1 Tax=Actinidia chinensis var. chinensis TaxID=1590841 RepID=A0A2R6RV13_ACTCC|nr:Calcium-transporting ATPase [Actinidia chinensis var. chinensis]
MSSINCDIGGNSTPLIARVHKLTYYVHVVSVIVALLYPGITFARYFSGNTMDEDGNVEFLGVDTSPVDIVYAISRIIFVVNFIVSSMNTDSFQWVVNIALAHSVKRLMAGKVVVQKLCAFETLSTATTIVIDVMDNSKLNEFKVTKFWVGHDKYSIGDGTSSSIAPNVLRLVQEGIGLNTSISGSPIESDILSWAILELNVNIEELNRCCSVQHLETSNSKKKGNMVFVRNKADNKSHIHWKGNAEDILVMCLSYYDASGSIKDLDVGERIKLEHMIRGMASSTKLQCFAFAHAQVTEDLLEDGLVDERVKTEGLTLLGLVFVKEPCQCSVRKAVEECKNAGVEVKMVTSDDLSIARATAIGCGLLEANEDVSSVAVIEGQEFQNYTPEERMERIDGIRVMATCSPSDKVDMIRCLKQKGHVVAVVSRPGPEDMTKKEACIGLSIGVQGNYYVRSANKSVDITIFDDNFASVVTILKWGRCAFNNTQKLIQFQLIASVVSVVTTFTTVASYNGTPYLDTRLGYVMVQLLWVSVVLAMFAAVALGMEQPDKEVMQRPPVDYTKPLISNIMWRNIAAQTLYQILITQILQFCGQSIFTVSDNVNNTMTFVFPIFCQVFNLFNARNLERKNVFNGAQKNRWFMGIVATIIVLQVVLVEVLQQIVSMERLDWNQWTACIGLAFATWPIDLVFKSMPVPDEPFQSYFHRGLVYLKSLLVDGWFKLMTSISLLFAS